MDHSQPLGINAVLHCAPCGLFAVRNWFARLQPKLGLKALRSVGDIVSTQVSSGDRRQGNSVRHRCRLIAASCQGQRPGSRAVGSGQEINGNRELLRASKDRSIR